MQGLYLGKSVSCSFQLLPNGKCVFVQEAGWERVCRSVNFESWRVLRGEGRGGGMVTYSLWLRKVCWICSDYSQSGVMIPRMLCWRMMPGIKDFCLTSEVEEYSCGTCNRQRAQQSTCAEN